MLPNHRLMKTHVHQLKEVLSERFDKEELIDRLEQDPQLLQEAIDLMFSNKEPYSWRSAWVLKDYFRNHKKLVNRYLNSILEVLPKAGDSLQRELLHIAELSSPDDEQEGRLFEVCLTNWESICKKGSVRHVSFTILVKIIRRYPELVNELKHALDPEYLDTLSPGIRKAVEKQIATLDLE